MAKTGFVSEAGAHSFSFDSPGNTHFSITIVLVEEENKREVKESFLRYIQENHQVDLFSPATFAFSNAEVDGLLQLAGILGESLNLFHAGLLEVDVEQELARRCVGVTR